MWTMCVKGIVEKMKQMCVDSVSNRKEIDVNMMKVLNAH
jgi:hypothetical protein